MGESMHHPLYSAKPSRHGLLMESLGLQIGQGVCNGVESDASKTKK
jgi:hypothetical protein